MTCFYEQRKEPKGEAGSPGPATPIRIPDCPVPASLLEELLRPPPAVSKEPLKNLNSCLQQLKYVPSVPGFVQLLKQMPRLAGGAPPAALHAGGGGGVAFSQAGPHAMPGPCCSEQTALTSLQKWEATRIASVRCGLSLLAQDSRGQCPRATWETSSVILGMQVTWYWPWGDSFHTATWLALGPQVCVSHGPREVGLSLEQTPKPESVLASTQDREHC